MLTHIHPTTRLLRNARRAVGAASAELTYTTRAASRWVGGFGAETIQLPTTDPIGAVMLVHGFGSNKSHFTALERVLLAQGFTVYSVNYPWARTSLAAAGEHVAADAATFTQFAQTDQIHIVGHSLGGVVSRWALGNTSLGEHTVSLTTLGSPHRGTPLAHLAPTMLPVVGALLTQLRMASGDLEALPHPATLPHVKHTAIGGTLDVIVPARYATLPAAANVTNELTIAGHIAMPASRNVMRRILRVLHAADAATSTAA